MTDIVVMGGARTQQAAQDRRLQEAQEIERLIREINQLAMILHLLEIFRTYDQPITIVIRPDGIAIKPRKLIPADPTSPNHAENKAQQVLAQLPKEQRESVQAISVEHADGVGGIQGWYDPVRRQNQAKIFLDSADFHQDYSGERTAHTIAHESFHAFTVQKLLPAWQQNKNSGYGQKMESLFTKYKHAMQSGDRNAFPTDYAASHMVKMHHAVMAGDRREAARQFEVGFMEYTAELAANIETGKDQSPHPHVAQAYAAMRSVLQQANGGKHVAMISAVPLSSQRGSESLSMRENPILSWLQGYSG
ncbi:hypothetical protein [Candidatus Magnetaquicoccus inordinatus]|uniref:hypothetical protein n=1 Tax=Candidatus Magnetaquicoccus inordinatus TaxID=2496818 RepID=UPI00102C3FE5|nr:hypothetical protein [Candidatus Magnetaquicoccus inordinatus]